MRIIGLAEGTIHPDREGISEVRLCHSAVRVGAVFDDPNLVASAGVVPVMRLAEQAGLHDLVEDRVRIPESAGANPAAKVGSIVAGMLTGADSIDDLDVVRHGGMGRLFTGARAPSTVGTFLRAFTWGHARQLESVARQITIGLASRTPLLPGAEQMMFLDADSTLGEVFGHAKQGAAFGHAKVGGYVVRLRGYHPLIATLSTPTAAPVIAATRLRAGNAGSARGAASMARELISVARGCGGQPGRMLFRGDSAFYVGELITACRQAGVAVSVTINQYPSVVAAIAGVQESAWMPIRYPKAVWDAQTQAWISDAEIAETPFTAFAADKQHRVVGRLVVRRVRDQNHLDALFPVWRCHAFFTTSTAELVEAEATHRQHAVIEHVNDDLKHGPLAHFPSGCFAANAAWLTCAAIAFNLTRAAGCLAGGHCAKARIATLRRQLINVPARIAHRARRLILHLPQHWPWEPAWLALSATAHAPPRTA
ncbi:TnpC protein [Kutzneria sp. 744]|nr:TnpC protein [Kutzneria sp. 744]